MAMSSRDHCTVFQWCCGLVKTTLVLVTVLDTVLALVLGLKNLFYRKKNKDTNMKGSLTFQGHLGDLKTNLLSVDQTTNGKPDVTAIKRSFVYALRLNMSKYNVISVY